mmetsp:Transcript_11786/g.38787  ORF Transcript_11786/g.38787 Transcript_11786/m.38787 type:complete len:320 (+) Transcript_11786:241-1200(+)
MCCTRVRKMRTRTGSSSVGVRRSTHCVVMSESTTFSGPSPSGLSSACWSNTTASKAGTRVPRESSSRISASEIPLVAARTPVNWNSNTSPTGTATNPGGAKGGSGGGGGYAEPGGSDGASTPGGGDGTVAPGGGGGEVKKPVSPYDSPREPSPVGGRTLVAPLSRKSTSLSPVRLGSTAYTVQLIGSRFCCSAVKNSYVPRSASGNCSRTMTGLAGVGVRGSNHLLVSTASIRLVGPSPKGDWPPETVALETWMNEPARLRSTISASEIPLSGAATPRKPRTAVKWNSIVEKARPERSPMPGGSRGRGGGAGAGGGITT